MFYMSRENEGLLGKSKPSTVCMEILPS